MSIAKKIFNKLDTLLCKRKNVPSWKFMHNEGDTEHAADSGWFCESCFPIVLFVLLLVNIWQASEYEKS